MPLKCPFVVCFDYDLDTYSIWKHVYFSCKNIFLYVPIDPNDPNPYIHSIGIPNYG